MSNNNLIKQQLKLVQDTLFFNPFFYHNREQGFNHGTATVVKETHT